MHTRRRRAVAAMRRTCAARRGARNAREPDTVQFVQHRRAFPIPVRDLDLLPPASHREQQLASRAFAISLFRYLCESQRFGGGRRACWRNGIVHQPLPSSARSARRGAACCKRARPPHGRRLSPDQVGGKPLASARIVASVELPWRQRRGRLLLRLVLDGHVKTKVSRR